MSSKFKSLPRPRLSKILDSRKEKAAALPLFTYSQRILYVTTEHQANNALRKITSGKVGFDTEYTYRRPTTEEQFIIDAFPSGGAARKNAILGWQVVELRTRLPFPIAWNNIGLRLVQIATDEEAFVLDMWKIRAFPKELRRILTSPDIIKVGVGASNDLLVLWDDLRTDMNNVVDAGMMARLFLAPSHPKPGYGPLSLKTSAADVLGFTVVKEQTDSNWSADDLSADQKEYAAVDAIVSLALHDELEGALARKTTDELVDIPSAWYTFNGRNGEPTRLKPGYDDAEIPWKTGDCTWWGGGKFIGYP
ncbi:ribonuclease H-like domain-containing protein [Mycena vitilis]|nr:ribonuclease H-like domain-containing protein [Mycena vitilis]